MTKTLKIVLVAVLVAVGLSACKDPSIEERIKAREECEEADGTYHEYPGFDSLEYWCDLERE